MPGAQRRDSRGPALLVAALLVLGQCSTEAFIPSDEYAATLHLTESTCTGAGAAWVAASSAFCTAPDCSFTANDPDSCGFGCTYGAEVVEVCTAVASSTMGEAVSETTCELSPICEATDAAACAAVVLDGAESTCTGAGDCVYTAEAVGVPEQCKAAQSDACAQIDRASDASCESVSGCSPTNTCSKLTGHGSCVRTLPRPEMCTATDLPLADGDAATAACVDDWRPYGCDESRTACEEAATGNTWDMHGVRHVPCSSRQGGLCSIEGAPCTAPSGAVRESCAATDEAVCAAVVTPPCYYVSGVAGTCGTGCVYTAADSNADPPVAESCEPADGAMQTACNDAGDCTYTPPDALTGTGELCAATHKAACAEVVVNGTGLTVHGTTYSTEDECETVTGCMHTPSDFFIIAADERECEIRDSGGVWTNATAATCTRADGTSIDDPPDSTEPCVAEKAACRGTPACNSVLEAITTASLAGTSATDLSATYTDGTDRGAEFAALAECMTTYTDTKQTFDSFGGACGWPASDAEGFVQTTLVLAGGTAAQTVSVPAYVDETRCRWSVTCAGAEREPVVNVRRLGTEAGFDILRVYDAPSAPTDLCTTHGCKTGCGEKACASGLKGTMGYDGPYWTRTATDCTFTSGTPSSCGAGCTYSAGDAQADPVVPETCVENLAAVTDTGLVLEFVSDLHNSYGEVAADSSAVQGGFEFTYQCVSTLEYGCTDPAAGNYDAGANANAAWKHGDDFCDPDTPCMGPRMQGLHAECSE
jgi:hypothetical protein